MPKKIFIIIIGFILSIVVLFSLGQTPTQPKLEVMVQGDPNMENLYSITLINPGKFSGDVKNNLEANLNESIYAASFFINNITSSVIGPFKINNENVFTVNNNKKPFNFNISNPSNFHQKLLFGVTTTFESSGVLSPIIQKLAQELPFNVSFVIKGSNAIINDAEQGNLNVILTHSPVLEKGLLSGGYSLYHSLVFTSQFVIIGPSTDPAHIRNLQNGSLALTKIREAALKNPAIHFISRGDLSGTNTKELELWNASNTLIDFKNSTWVKDNPWYIITGSGQAATFLVTQQYGGYMLIDIPSFLRLSATYPSATLQNDFFKALQSIFSANNDLFSIIVLSLQIHTSAIIGATVVGLFVTYLIYSRNFYGKTLLVAIIQSSMAFPPVVLGLLMWYIFSNNGLLGNLQLLYTSPIMVLAQFLLALPIIISLSLTAFESINSDTIELSKMLKIKGIHYPLFLIKESRNSLITAIMTALGRIMGETGAMLIVSGYIYGRTRIITTSIVNEIDSGVPSNALALGIILLILTLVIMTILTVIQRYHKLLPQNLIFKYTWYNIRKDMKDISSSTIAENISDTNKALTYFQNFLLTYPSSGNLKDEDRIIELKNCSFRYNSSFKLTIEDVRLVKGEIYGIIGPNSSGKTTFSKLLVDLEHFKCEKNTIYDSENWIYIHQKPTFVTGTVYQNLLIALKNKKEPKKEKIENIIVLTKIFGVYEYLGHNIRDLSLGTQQKISVIRSLLMKPELLILDETFSNLDMKTILLVTELLKELNQKEKTTILIISHNLTILSKIVSNFIVIIDGSVIETFEKKLLHENLHKKLTNEFLELNLSN